MDKLSKTAGTLDTVAKVLFWFTAVVTALMTVLMIVGAFLPAEALGEVTTDLTLDNIILHLSDSAVKDVSFGTTFLPILILGTLEGLFITYSIYILRRILAPMIDRQPFAETVSHQLRHLSWVTMIGGGVLSIITAVYQYISLNMYDLDALFVSDAIVDYTIEYRVDLSFVAVFFVLQLLSFVFRYGAALQKESDETL